MACPACATAPNATVKHGDTGTKAKVVAVLTDSLGHPVDLTGFTGVLLHLRSQQTGVTVSVFGTVDGDPQQGVVSWTPNDADWIVVLPGRYSVEWEITFTASELTAPTDGYSELLVSAELA